MCVVEISQKARAMSPIIIHPSYVYKNYLIPLVLKHYVSGNKVCQNVISQNVVNHKSPGCMITQEIICSLSTHFYQTKWTAWIFKVQMRNWGFMHHLRDRQHSNIILLQLRAWFLHWCFTFLPLHAIISNMISGCSYTCESRTQIEKNERDVDE